jgi:glycerophosphoryl diester phosphodiesterase
MMTLRIAHRGAPHFAPENSLQGFQKALTFSPDFVEFDLRLTGDGHAVCIHDKTINRMTDGKGKVAKMTLEKLRTFRLANGEPIPTFAEALEAIHGRAEFKIDVKQPGMEEIVVRALRRMGIIRNSIVIAYGRKSLLAFKREGGPSLRTEVGGIYARHARLRAISTANKTGAGIISIRHTLVSAKFAEKCHRQGIDIHAWTVNTKKDADRMRALGVAAIATDRLDLV